MLNTTGSIIFNTICQVIPQLFPKLLKPDDRKSKAFTSSLLNNLTSEIINPKDKGTSITATISDIRVLRESENRLSIIPKTANINVYARAIHAAFPHLPDSFSRASFLKSEETINIHPFLLL